MVLLLSSGAAIIYQCNARLLQEIHLVVALLLYLLESSIVIRMSTHLSCLRDAMWWQRGEKRPTVWNYLPFKDKPAIQGNVARQEFKQELLIY